MQAGSVRPKKTPNKFTFSPPTGSKKKSSTRSKPTSGARVPLVGLAECTKTMKAFAPTKQTTVAELRDYFARNSAEVNQENEQGVTPLITGLASNRPEVVECLLKLSADPNYTSDKAPLPLIYAIDGAVAADDYGDEAAFSRSLQNIRLLLQYGASPQAIDQQEGQSPSEYAVGRLPEVEGWFRGQALN